MGAFEGLNFGDLFLRVVSNLPIQFADLFTHFSSSKSRTVQHRGCTWNGDTRQKSTNTGHNTNSGSQQVEIGSGRPEPAMTVYTRGSEAPPLNVGTGGLEAPPSLVPESGLGRKSSCKDSMFGRNSQGMSGGTRPSEIVRRFRSPTTQVLLESRNP